jgi:hypothetical protein
MKGYSESRVAMIITMATMCEEYIYNLSGTLATSTVQSTDLTDGQLDIG